MASRNVARPRGKPDGWSDHSRSVKRKRKAAALRGCDRQENKRSQAPHCHRLKGISLGSSCMNPTFDRERKNKITKRSDVAGWQRSSRLPSPVRLLGLSSPTYAHRQMHSNPLAKRSGLLVFLLYPSNQHLMKTLILLMKSSSMRLLPGPPDVLLFDALLVAIELWSVIGLLGARATVFSSNLVRDYLIQRNRISRELVTTINGPTSPTHDNELEHFGELNVAQDATAAEPEDQFELLAPAIPQKRGAGRPPGSKNRPKPINGAGHE
jgi:hypothetical protein